MKHSSTYLAVSTDRIFAAGQKKIHCSCISSLLNVARVTVLCGAANFGVMDPYFYEDERLREAHISPPYNSYFKNGVAIPKFPIRFHGVMIN
jgi:hypothetical protein